MHLGESTCRSWSSVAGRTCWWPTAASTGLVLALGPGFDTLEVDGHRVRAGAALSLPVLARRTAAAGLTGLEWAVGVPGSVGGAIRMNAGGHGSDTAATLVGFRWIDLATGSVRDSPADRLEPGYRQTAVSATEVVVSGTFLLDRATRAEGRPPSTRSCAGGGPTSPGGSNAGSVFANPPGDSAGRLIDACGLKGFRIGTAEVSTKHANFVQADPGGRRGGRPGRDRARAGRGGPVHRDRPAHRGPAGRVPRTGGAAVTSGPPVGPDPPDQRILIDQDEPVGPFGRSGRSERGHGRPG